MDLELVLDKIRRQKDYHELQVLHANAMFDIIQTRCGVQHDGYQFNPDKLDDVDDEIVGAKALNKAIEPNQIDMDYAYSLYNRMVSKRCPIRFCYYLDKLISPRRGVLDMMDYEVLTDSDKERYKNLVELIKERLNKMMD